MREKGTLRCRGVTYIEWSCKVHADNVYIGHITAIQLSYSYHVSGANQSISFHAKVRNDGTRMTHIYTIHVQKRKTFSAYNIRSMGRQHVIHIWSSIMRTQATIEARTVTFKKRIRAKAVESVYYTRNSRGVWRQHASIWWIAIGVIVRDALRRNLEGLQHRDATLKWEEVKICDNIVRTIFMKEKKIKKEFWKENEIEELTTKKKNVWWE